MLVAFLALLGEAQGEGLDEALVIVHVLVEDLALEEDGLGHFVPVGEALGALGYSRGHLLVEKLAHTAARLGYLGAKGEMLVTREKFLFSFWKFISRG